MRACLRLLAAVLVAACGGCTGPGLLERQSWLFGKDPPDDPALMARLGPTPTQRIALVRSLREKMSDSPAEADRVARELAQRIQAEEDPGVRIEIIRALAESKTAVGMAVLKAGISYPNPDPHEDVRVAICEAWGNLQTAEGRPLLAAVLASDTNEDVRIAAASALGEFEDAGSVQALAPALEDSSIAVQHAAMQSMKAVSGQDFGDNAAKWREYAKTGAATETPSIAGRLWPWR